MRKKSLFKPVTTTVFPSTKVPASLSSIYVPKKKSTVTTDYIITIGEIVGTDSREFMFGGADGYKKLAKTFVDMDKACHTYFSVTCNTFVINCYELLL